jgi:hypothetical protein
LFYSIFGIEEKNGKSDKDELAEHDDDSNGTDDRESERFQEQRNAVVTQRQMLKKLNVSSIFFFFEHTHKKMQVESEFCCCLLFGMDWCSYLRIRTSKVKKTGETEKEDDTLKAMKRINRLKLKSLPQQLTPFILYVRKKKGDDSLFFQRIQSDTNVIH